MSSGLEKKLRIIAIVTLIIIVSNLTVNFIVKEMILDLILK